jgi:hypothetical protein
VTATYAPGSPGREVTVTKVLATMALGAASLGLIVGAAACGGSSDEGGENDYVPEDIYASTTTTTPVVFQDTPQMQQT